ncbi:MAG: SGNH/GDSL hydrolase family protein [Propionicimonas sp.]
MRRLLGALAALALSFTGLIGSAAAPAQAATPAVATAKATTRGYAALGDSFAAGYGLPSKSDAADIACARSNLAYPELLNGLHRLRHLDFLACSGATTFDLVNAQLPSLSASTRTVTLTIGGNDLGFSQLACLQTGCDLSGLIAAIRPALAALAGGPPVVGPGGTPVQSLVSVLAAIHAKAPRAKIFLTGYPELFGSAAKLYGTPTACPVTLADRSAVNAVVDQLNAVIEGSAAAARAGGVPVTYVGVAAAFSGHGVCDTRVPFISAVLHPTFLGQATYASALVRKGVAR